MSIHAVLLAVSGCALLSAVAGGPLASRTPQLRQTRLMALLISGALMVGNAACLLPDVPTWYSATLITLTTVGLFWVIAATLSAQRDAAAQARQERAAERIRQSAAPARPPAQGSAQGSARGSDGPRESARPARCERPRQDTSRGGLYALPTPTDPDGPARPALGRSRPGRPHLTVVQATPVAEAGAAAPSSSAPSRSAALLAPRALPRPSAAAVVTNLPALPAAQRTAQAAAQASAVAPASDHATRTADRAVSTRTGDRAVATRTGDRSVATREDLNAVTPLGTHPQSLYVARDIATYSEPDRARQRRFARVDARATLAAAWRARVADAYDDTPRPVTRLRDTRA